MFPLVSGGKGSGQLLRKLVTEHCERNMKGTTANKLDLKILSEVPEETAHIFSLVTTSNIT